MPGLDGSTASPDGAVVTDGVALAGDGADALPAFVPVPPVPGCLDREVSAPISPLPSEFGLVERFVLAESWCAAYGGHLWDGPAMYDLHSASFGEVRVRLPRTGYVQVMLMSLDGTSVYMVDEGSWYIVVYDPGAFRAISSFGWSPSNWPEYAATTRFTTIVAMDLLADGRGVVVFGRRSDEPMVGGFLDLRTGRTPVWNPAPSTRWANSRGPGIVVTSANHALALALAPNGPSSLVGAAAGRADPWVIEPPGLPTPIGWPLCIDPSGTRFVAGNLGLVFDPTGRILADLRVRVPGGACVVDPRGDVVWLLGHSDELGPGEWLIRRDLANPDREPGHWPIPGDPTVDGWHVGFSAWVVNGGRHIAFTTHAPWLQDRRLRGQLRWLHVMAIPDRS